MKNKIGKIISLQSKKNSLHEKRIFDLSHRIIDSFGEGELDSKIASLAMIRILEVVMQLSGIQDFSNLKKLQDQITKHSN